MKVRFAVAPGPAATDLDRFGRVLDHVESLGFDAIWLSDIPLGAPVDPIVGLSFAAARTTRLKLGANLVPLGRHPLTLAKSLAQLDRLAGGRLLLSFVVGLGQPEERAALGVGAVDRGRRLEEMTGLVRTWVAGGTVGESAVGSLAGGESAGGGQYRLGGLASPARSVQEPLEIWFGGRAPAALRRVGRSADGWLGAAVTAAEAGPARQEIERAAAAAGRRIDPEHFGLSIPYAPTEAAAASAEVAGRRRRPDVPSDELLPVGPARLTELVGRYVDAGLSKFVVRPLGPDADQREDLARLADVLLPLQT